MRFSLGLLIGIALLFLYDALTMSLVFPGWTLTSRVNAEVGLAVIIDRAAGYK